MESLGEIAVLTGGVFSGGDPGRRPSGYSIDTRTTREGDLFFAIAGARQDGHLYAAEAVRKGAAAVVVSERSAAPAGAAAIVVKDTTRALQDLAAARRRRCPAKVIGITGSSGKTTTKEMTRHVLEGSFNVTASTGNLNNLFGVPLSLLKLSTEHQVAVLEMGMSTHGELSRLAEIADPDVGVLTNVSGAHLEFFSDIDDYARAKGELFAGMRPNTTGVFNGDDPRSRRIAESFRGYAVTFGMDTSADFTATGYRGDGLDGSTFELQHGGRRRRVKLRYVGAHQAMNATAAIAAGFMLGAELDRMIERIGTLEPQAMRGRALTLRGGVRVLDDSYNANPGAMRAALAVLTQTTPAGSGRRIVVLGDMLELGAEAEARHREIGTALGPAGVDRAVVVGALMRHAAAAAREAGFSPITAAATAEEAAAAIVPELRAGDVVLVKGSRGIGLDRVVAAIVGALGAAAGALGEGS
ncbi:MAG: UDP-N-acetylmuramoyl-tripeptide--D-alanyl-D-alanine ligase [Acidobacteria bacterium]|nr:UDP-N-acetylmuramoyl-tripeptide--D-alanyl-D-alanine ligase [Acidobacteriota bacterium]